MELNAWRVKEVRHREWPPGGGASKEELESVINERVDTFFVLQSQCDTDRDMDILLDIVRENLPRAMQTEICDRISQRLLRSR